MWILWRVWREFQCSVSGLRDAPPALQRRLTFPKVNVFKCRRRQMLHAAGRWHRHFYYLCTLKAPAGSDWHSWIHLFRFSLSVCVLSVPRRAESCVKTEFIATCTKFPWELERRMLLSIRWFDASRVLTATFLWTLDRSTSDLWTYCFHWDGNWTRYLDGELHGAVIS